MNDTWGILFPPLEFWLRGGWDESIAHPCTIENEETVRWQFELWVFGTQRSKIKGVASKASLYQFSFVERVAELVDDDLSETETENECCLRAGVLA